MSVQSFLTARRWSRPLAGAAGLSILALLCGCPGSGNNGEPCGTATIEGSDGANNEFTQLTATQCDVDFDTGDLVLTIDILERMDGDPSPRVLFTLTDVSEIPADGTLSLARTDDEDLAPAVYQEFTGPVPSNPTLAGGPFWSSTEGTIMFDTDDEGNVIATFEFSADNPRPDNPSTATGTVDVSGSVLLVAGQPANMCGAMGAGGSMGLLLTLAGMTACKRRLRR
jgi:hypothetical protein